MTETMTGPLLDPVGLAVVIPLLGALAAFAFPRGATSVGLFVGLANFAVAAALAVKVATLGPADHALGAWGAPLGIDLRADGLSVVMLLMTAGVGFLVSLTAIGVFAPIRGESEARGRGRAYFPPLWLLLLAGLNALFLSTDVFNLYVTLEIVALASVGLAVLSGTRAALEAGLRYLLASLLGSLLFLLGVGLVYSAYGRLDLAGLGAIAEPSPVASVALVAMLAGLALKCALFPLHFWLPAAHANASAPASALLSALVVKGGLYVALRLFTEVFAPADPLALLIGLLGAAAVLWGSIEALRAERLKLLVAWSTVAQIGLIFVAFALSGTIGSGAAWQGAVFLMLAHAIAKAAMFLAAGRIAEEAGHDIIARLDRATVRPGLALFAFGLAAISLIGLPPSAGFVGKWLLMEGALTGGAWAWLPIALIGTALTAAYLSRPIVAFLRFDRVRGAIADEYAWRVTDLPPLLLAIAAVAFGLVATQTLNLLAIGSPLGIAP
jgi:multicomponent Na+:H+ antiporter subunit D